MREPVRETLRASLRAWMGDAGADVPVSVEPPPSGVTGDLGSSYPMALARALKRSPRDIAQALIERLPPEGPVARAEIAGPGFLNVIMRDEWLLDQLSLLLSERERYGRGTAGERILLEFVSANPNGPLHVGHGRGAALGDALARILSHLGHSVDTEYYVNNMGNQMDNLGASVLKRCLEIDPAYADADEAAVLAGKDPADLYKGAYIADIADEVVKTWPKESAREKGLAFFTREGVSRILQRIRRDLDGFGVHIAQWFPESTLHEQGAVDGACRRLLAEGFAREEDGTLWFNSTRFGDDKDRVMKRQDGRPTYFASDVAYHAEKIKRGYDRLINIWGTDHYGYVARLKASVQAMGGSPDMLTIVLYQLVALLRDGQPVAMSTRTGEFITLQEVVDEVGRDAARFFFAMRSPNSHLDFDLELAKKQVPENPVFYVQYVHARCAALFREAEKRGLARDAKRASWTGAIAPAERALLVQLLSFPDTVAFCGRDLSPHHLTTYLLQLAGDFHRFYEHCRVLGEAGPETDFRMALVDGVRSVIRTGLGLLGVGAPESM